MRNLTKRQKEEFLALVKYGNVYEAAKELGISPQTLKNVMGYLYRKIGASNRSHAAWLLYPQLGNQMTINFQRHLEND